MTTTGTSSSLKYDPLGRLYEVTVVPGSTTQFLYDGDALVAEYTVSGATATQQFRYAHGDQVDEPLVQYAGSTLANRRYLHTDHQGSIIALSDTTGAAVNKQTYDNFGVPGTGNTTRFGFTGQVALKELGLYYYKARIYAPRIGRFLQADPVFYKDDMNLYAYVRNDPVSNKDPTGLKCEGDAKTGKCTADMFNGVDIAKARKEFPTVVQAENSRSGDQPKRQSGRRSPTYKCWNCGQHHGGVRGAYCPECDKKSKDPKGGVPPNPRPPEDDEASEPSSSSQTPPESSGMSTGKKWAIGGTFVVGGAGVACAVIEPCGAVVLTWLGLSGGFAAATQ